MATAPFLNEVSAHTLLWGAGAAVLVCLFPWVLVRHLNRRGDLVTGLGRLGTPPIILGAAGACFVTLRVILWADGPRALAAVVFAMVFGYVVTLVFAKIVRMEWSDVTYAAAAGIFPVLLFLLSPGIEGTVAAVVLAGLFIVALLSVENRPASTTVGVVAAGLASAAVFVWLVLWGTQTV